MTLCEPRGWGYDQGRLHGRTLSPKAGKQWPRGAEFMRVEGRRADGGQAGGENVRRSPPDLSQPSWGVELWAVPPSFPGLDKEMELASPPMPWWVKSNIWGLTGSRCSFPAPHSSSPPSSALHLHAPAIRCLVNCRLPLQASASTLVPNNPVFMKHEL